MLILPSKDLCGAIDHVNYYENLAPGDVRRFCQFRAELNRVTLSVLGQDNIWIHHYIETTESIAGITLLVDGVSLERIKKLGQNAATQCLLKQSSSGAEVLSFQEYNSNGQPVILHQLSLGLYPGLTECFPIYTGPEEDDLVLTVPSNTFHQLMSVTSAIGEHVSRDQSARPVKLCFDPLTIYSNSQSSNNFRFFLQHDTLTVEDVEPVFLKGYYLQIIKQITTASTIEPVKIYINKDQSCITFRGQLGEVAIPITDNPANAVANQEFNSLDVYSDTVEYSRTVTLSMLEQSLSVQEPVGQNFPEVSIDEDSSNNMLQLYKAGDVVKREVSNIPYNLDYLEASEWKKLTVNYYSLKMASRLLRSVKAINSVKNELITLTAWPYNRSSTVKSRRRQENAKSIMLSLSLVDHSLGYRILIPVKSHESPT